MDMPGQLSDAWELDMRPEEHFAGKTWGASLAAMYPVLALTPLAILAALTPMSDRPRMAEAGVDCAVVGLTILALQFVVGGRLHWVEAPFGLDVLLVFHRSMALLAVAGTGASPWLRVVHVLSDAPPDWRGEAGRLDADRLARLCTGVAGKAFYLCCPPPMTSALVGGLRRLGVSPRRIHAEWFRL